MTEKDTLMSFGLPERKYFKIGEVAALVGVEPHVLRYWETQFPQVRPHKARSGHRLFRRREVQTLLVIRELLHVQRFTIAGARQALRQPGGIDALIPKLALQLRPEAHASVALIDAADDAADVDDMETSATAVEQVDAIALPADEIDEALSAQLHEHQAEAGINMTLVEVGTADEQLPKPLAAHGVHAGNQQALPLGPIPPSPAAAERSGLQQAFRSDAVRAHLGNALAEARSVLALLAREDARDPRRPHA